MNLNLLWSICLVLSNSVGITDIQQHPWHRVSPGKDVPRSVTAVIEIKQGSKTKYEIDKESGMLKLDRILKTSMVYPTNYGFIPQSYCGDKDPLDILVICSEGLQPASLVDAQVIGVMRMTDSGDQDDKIIAVAKHDAAVNHYKDIKDLPEQTMKEIVHFFQNYKTLEGKTVKIEKISGRDSAQTIILESLELYKKEFGQIKPHHGN
ncbi:inorganic diphosphatase [Sphingobacterium sp. CZ-2]|uniref:inorganic diphosphatase n=1 Tax=Sphingobacterium sp. CZ-2 TaxID=2557994 RepID=UPI00106FF2FB|nr:inorganic diphosphatase [Sphingobacterium sp. CZ-2]QBR12618.1 inorganic diphosphatase [Sphingobacterium sp. CZ-2]